MPRNNKNNPRELLGYTLTPKQDALVNYLIPSISSCVLYISLFASEVGLIYRHFKDDRSYFAWVTFLLVCLPSACSYIIISSSKELWPEMKLIDKGNFLWFTKKTLQHLMFPVWSLWRFAERLFWSIEAYTACDDKLRNEAIQLLLSPRTVELYLFLQAFLQCLPQTLFQLYLLMRHSHKTNHQTAHAQFLSIAFNLMKLSMTVACYQRFKTQKLAGSSYPWHKSRKYLFDSALDEVTMRQRIIQKPEDQVEVTDGPNRRSSNFYLEPTIRGSYLPSYSSRIQPNFDIRRVLYIKGLPEDDLAGRLVSFCWWSAFLLARILAIAAFQYFYPVQVIYILVGHFLLTLAILCYDAKSDQVTRSKAAFFLFVCYIYLFCLIEFKIRFKKTKFIYHGFFGLVYVENFVMCLIWWYGDLESIEKDYWFRYAFNLIVVCSLSSFAAMIFYFCVNKPKKVLVDEVLM